MRHNDELARLVEVTIIEYSDGTLGKSGKLFRSMTASYYRRYFSTPEQRGPAKVWRGTKDYGYPFDFWGWDGPGANITTSYGIPPGGTGTFSFHTANLITAGKTFSINTTEYCYSFYDPWDGSDNLDFEASGDVLIPEPGGVILIGLGLAGLARKRRK